MATNYPTLPWWTWPAGVLIAAAALLAHTRNAHELQLFQHTLANEPHLLVRGRTDDYPIATSRALEGRNIDTPVIYIVGTSAAREALFHQADLEQALAKDPDDGNVSVRDLSASAQRFLESFFLVELSAPQPGDIYYLYISPQNFLWNETENRKRLERGHYHFSAVNFYQQTLTRYLPDGHAVVATPFKERRYFAGKFLRNYLKQALAGTINQSLLDGKHPEYMRHRHDLPLHSEEREQQWQSIMLGKDNRAKKGMKHFEMNMEILRAILAYLHDQGARTYVMAPPTLPGILSSEYEKIAAAGMETLCNQVDAPTCIDLNKMAPLSEADFNDPVHLNSSGRQKWSDAFIELVKNTR